MTVAIIWMAREVISPDVGLLARENPKTTAFIELRKAQWRQKGLEKTPYQRWVPYDKISPYLTMAVTIAEDDGFWWHGGLDLEAIRNALETNLGKGKIKFGGSTITQQLAKNMYLTPEKTARRKMVEAALAIRMERTMSKRRILELYLNVVEWGDGVFGADAAARRWFGVGARNLTPEQAARLAAVLPSPLKLDPTKDGGYVERRAGQLVEEMKKRGLLWGAGDYKKPTPGE
ncbi:MAG: monofunctional biosynthetic peptidoglycan transglycosylase, partial [Nitrospinota bacterium]|nr:monofunctional biosynthetic peptidoglycan transglycosylase [Nitrospinota bacterium]